MNDPREGRQAHAVMPIGGIRCGLAASTESGAPEAWDFIRVLSSPGSALPDDESARGELINTLDWLAEFTRQHFSNRLQSMLGGRIERSYILHRMEMHSEIRRRLAVLCVDATFERPSWAALRMREFCAELLIDAEVYRER